MPFLFLAAHNFFRVCLRPVRSLPSNRHQLSWGAGPSASCRERGVDAALLIAARRSPKITGMQETPIFADFCRQCLSSITKRRAILTVGSEPSRIRYDQAKATRARHGRGRSFPRQSRFAAVGVGGRSLGQGVRSALNARLVTKFGPKLEFTDEEMEAAYEELDAEGAFPNPPW